MKKLSRCALADLSIDITWNKNGIKHREHYFADQFNCWRDTIPGSVFDNIMDCSLKDAISFKLNPGELVPEYRKDKVIVQSLKGLNSNLSFDGFKPGRFYPKGILSGVRGVFRSNMNPFRCLNVDSKSITADINHPMAGLPLSVEMSVDCAYDKSEERGGSCTDWIELALSGPGMQARYNGLPTDFLSGNPFRRRDSLPDPVFYEKDRFVSHVDDMAKQNISRLYKTLLKPGDSVLDLMAGWESHIPDDFELSCLHGLGLNRNELSKNKRLTDYTVQDLNTDTRLYFKDHTFDAVICSLSIEYLIDPVPVFKEVARVLNPGGIFGVSFSNRWFPEKTIGLWEDLHDFERMGLVTEYFLESGLYESISTVSMRGYPRPFEDKHFPEIRLSDPVYAVVGKIPAP